MSWWCKNFFWPQFFWLLTPHCEGRSDEWFLSKEQLQYLPDLFLFLWGLLACGYSKNGADSVFRLGEDSCSPLLFLSVSLVSRMEVCLFLGRSCYCPFSRSASESLHFSRPSLWQLEFKLRRLNFSSTILTGSSLGMYWQNSWRCYLSPLTHQSFEWFLRN